jgi:hypothetical protein
MLLKTTTIFFAFVLLLKPGTVSPTGLRQESSSGKNVAQATQSETSKKAFDLIEQVIIEARTLRLPENRAFIQTAAADLLWPHDEKGARALFGEALANINELADDAAQDEPEFINCAQIASELRRELLLKAARHDAALARELARLIRPSLEQPGDQLPADSNSGTQTVSPEQQPARAGIESTNEDSTSDAEDINDAATPAPPEIRDGFYAEVAAKAERAGDLESARRMANHITDQFQRRETLAAINRQYLLNAAREGKLEQTLGSLQLLRTLEERASVLCELAAVLAQRNEKERALELLNQARNLLAHQPRNYAQINARLQVACAFATLDPDQSFEMIGSIVNQLNELAAATRVVDGFTTEEQFTRNDELILKQTLQFFESHAYDGAQNDSLTLLARSEFDRLKDAANKFQHAELRTLARLSLAEIVLTE